MVEFDHSVSIARSPQEVFDYVTNPANDAQWQDSIVSSEWASEGPPGVGSEVRSTVKFMGRKFESTNEITEWNPPGQYALKVSEGPVPFELSVRFEPAEGGTQLSMRGQAEVGSFFKLAEGLVGKQLQKQFQSDLNRLKSQLEG